MDFGAKLIAVTQPLLDVEGRPFTNDQVRMTADQFIAYAARVSNPGNQINNETAPRLIAYLVKHRHWSPFEIVSATLQIDATRDIGRQILRHRSFSFQEFSQRYADPTSSFGFVRREARLQHAKNRQLSVTTDDEILKAEWISRQDKVVDLARENYRWAVDHGIAKEQARVILPEGLTPTRLYMAGTLRSWIHYVKDRTAAGVQAEHREIALLVREEIFKYFPSLSEVFYGVPETVGK
jgi:thymidylate synthase (FAD)